MQQTLNYQALDELITQQQWWFSPSYAHGVLSALVALESVERYGEFLFFEQEQSALAKKAFPMMAEHIAKSLKLENLHYQLMLPPEGSVSWRAEALADWALAVSRVWETIPPAVADEALEFVHDVANIAELNPVLVNNERNQQQLTEVEEYCRIGVVMVYEAVHASSDE